MPKKNTAYVGSRRRLIVATVLFVIMISFYIGGSFSDWAQILANRKSVNDLNEKYTLLLEEEASLKSEVTKLQDPEYIAKYAREKFYYSKPGEMIIIRLPEE